MSPAQARLARWLASRPGELRTAAASALLFFTVLAACFVLRPVRDEMGVQAGVHRLPTLVTWTLLAMLVASVAFGALVARLPRRRFLPLALRAFALMLLGFAAWALAEAGTPSLAFAQAWFTWLSVFNMFVVALFWAFMADTWRPEAAARLYGPIGVGGTLGAIAGGLCVPGLKALLGEGGLAPLLGGVFVVGALLLEACVHLVRRVTREAQAAGAEVAGAGPGAEARDQAVLGGGALEGLRALASSPYLAGAGLVVLLGSVLGSVLWAVRLQAVAASPLDAAARTALFSWSEVAAQSLTLLVQLVGTARLLPRLGTGLVLGLLPLAYAGFLLALGLVPGLVLAVVAVALTRATQFALAKPAQETLFSVVARRDKYKAKSALDTLGARLGDWLGSQGAGWVATAVGSGPGPLALCAAPLCGLWLLLALAMGHARSRRAAAAAGGRAPADG